jgi:hypothetical protein
MTGGGSSAALHSLTKPTVNHTDALICKDAKPPSAGVLHSARKSDAR